MALEHSNGVRLDDLVAAMADARPEFGRFTGEGLGKFLKEHDRQCRFHIDTDG
eukprot:CAMPEP_0204148010 /NCGR_PEP_ID=MMETSP0361-20130328/23205_1 /ASSEMBLY_ACC=CAM_ASM_000343 /TAXON_ID=268821 /ORGANISM="Scrippsiella Hangoei, Strain SHTV-5" /LENGTH=52 /DNA_ID=CAMNT_0051102295 /DNA_START=24 /DNA_END=179 /DNA_ORIENTATION=+